MKRAVVLGALLAVFAAGCAAPASDPVVRFRFSRFEPEVLNVRAGEPITITLRNDDPIEHEWIVGPPAVHEAHRVGTEAYHASRPTEVTVPALTSRVTRVTFDQPGEYAVICHLPGHEAYGMSAILRVS